MAIPSTSVGGNVWSPPAKNERINGQFTQSFTVPANANNATFEFPLYVVPAFPGNPKLTIKQGRYLNGNVASTLSTTVTVKVKNYTNAKDEMVGKTLVAADIVDCAGTSYIAAVLALSSATSDRSTSPGGSTTEPDYNCFPGDVLYVEIIADAGSTVTAGSQVEVTFAPVDFPGTDA